MKLQDCRDKKLRWDLTPQTANPPIEIRTQEDLRRAVEITRSHAGAYFYINVWNCQAPLALMELDEKGNGQSWIIKQTIISDDELEEAVWDQGGAINLSGHYALPTYLQERIRNLLEEA